MSPIPWYSHTSHYAPCPSLLLQPQCPLCSLIPCILFTLLLIQPFGAPLPPPWHITYSSKPSVCHEPVTLQGQNLHPRTPSCSQERIRIHWKICVCGRKRVPGKKLQLHRQGRLTGCPAMSSSHSDISPQQRRGPKPSKVLCQQLGREWLALLLKKAGGGSCVSAVLSSAPGRQIP